MPDQTVTTSLKAIYTGVGWDKEGEPYVRLYCPIFMSEGAHTLTPDDAERLAGLLMTMATLARQNGAIDA